MVDLDSLDLFDSGETENEGKNSEFSLKALLPKEGLYLGLDISKTSTGVAYIENGEYTGGNIVLDEQQGRFKEVLYRRNLKQYLEELVKGKHFEVIIIEDAFVGENAETVRLLFALNTAIDELLLDDVCTCNEFHRVNNQMWKSWLYGVDKNGLSKGLKDKEKIKICMQLLGVEDSGEGYQDRLDSLGMLLGFFLKGKGLVQDGIIKKKISISINDIKTSYESEMDFIFFGFADSEVSQEDVVFLPYNKIGKNKVLELLADDPTKVYITSEKVLLGYLGKTFEQEQLIGGGYFAFWIDRKKLNKYIKKMGYEA